MTPRLNARDTQGIDFEGGLETSMVDLFRCHKCRKSNKKNSKVRKTNKNSHTNKTCDYL